MVKVGGGGGGEENEAAVGCEVYGISSSNDEKAEKGMDGELD